MRFHPVISIFFGFLVFLLPFWIVFFILAKNVLVYIIVLILSFIISGFIATHFARERKIKYSLYELIPVFIILLFLGQIISCLLALLFIPLGGMFGLRIDKCYIHSFKSKYWDKGFSLVSIITGVLFIFVIWFFISLITYTIISATNISILTINLINTTELIAISVIGGFISTYIGKEKE